MKIIIFLLVCLFVSIICTLVLMPFGLTRFAKHLVIFPGIWVGWNFDRIYNKYFEKSND